jgi:hypothetical protein
VNVGPGPSHLEAKQALPAQLAAGSATTAACETPSKFVTHRFGVEMAHFAGCDNDLVLGSEAMRAPVSGGTVDSTPKCPAKASTKT